MRGRALATVEQAIELTEAVLPRLARLAAQPGPRRLDARAMLAGAEARLERLHAQRRRLSIPGAADREAT